MIALNAEAKITRVANLLTRHGDDLVYIDGFGLCTAILLGQARALIHEQTSGNGA